MSYEPDANETLRRARAVMAARAGTAAQLAEWALGHLTAAEGLALVNGFLRGTKQPDFSVFVQIDRWVNARWTNPRFKYRIKMEYAKQSKV